MAVTQYGGHCYTCQQQRMFIKQKPSHVLHLVLSVLTAGIWALFVWLPLSVKAGNKPARCQVCGTPRGTNPHGTVQ